MTLLLIILLVIIFILLFKMKKLYTGKWNAIKDSDEYVSLLHIINFQLDTKKQLSDDVIKNIKNILKINNS